MYEAYFGFDRKPFALSADSDFLYLGKIHSTAYAMLEYGVLHQAGFTVITGEVGSGKSTLIQHLLGKLDSRITVGLINHTRRNMGELMPWVLHAFKLDYRDGHPVALYDSFAKFLQKQAKAHLRTVLLIDEAQNLTAESLDELRMLSNLSSPREHTLQIILSGQPELRQMLRRPELMQFAQRVAADYHIAPLTLRESIHYIRHRQLAAGGRRDIFEPDAYPLIHGASRGVPRLINIVCDTALAYAFGDGLTTINAEFIKVVLVERSEGGLLALGQNPLRELGQQAYNAPDLEALFKNSLDGPLKLKNGVN